MKKEASVAEQTGSRKAVIILGGVAILIDVITFLLMVSEKIALRTALIVFIVGPLVLVPMFIIARNARRS